MTWKEVNFIRLFRRIKKRLRRLSCGKIFFCKESKQKTYSQYIDTSKIKKFFDNLIFKALAFNSNLMTKTSCIVAELKKTKTSMLRYISEVNRKWSSYSQKFDVHRCLRQFHMFFFLFSKHVVPKLIRNLWLMFSAE